ncbi:MAG: hypothetical protein J6S42_01500 [Thermoguttaceae bacterium]|nr:hypothetical protein [Thermoguttaceae bacterium]
MDKINNSVKAFLRKTFPPGVVLLFCGLFLAPGTSVTQRAAGNDDRHVLLEETDVRARRAGFDVSPKNLTPQPVQIKTPEGIMVEIASEGGFTANPAGSNLFGLLQGEVYRFKFTRLPYAEGRELYPTVELLSTLTPPRGYETDFPIPIELTEEDIRMALDGNLVTRVVYLEPPHNAIPVDSTVDQGEISSEAPSSINPVALAKSRGRVMAILRLGSRIPDTKTDLSGFCFGYPAVTFPAPSDKPRGYMLGYPIPAEPTDLSDPTQTELTLP